MRKKSATTSSPGPVAAAAVNKAVRAFGEPSPNGHIATLENIRLRAYLKWEAAGRPPNDGVSFWVEAEKEVLHQA